MDWSRSLRNSRLLVAAEIQAIAGHQSLLNALLRCHDLRQIEDMSLITRFQSYDQNQLVS